MRGQLYNNMDIKKYTSYFHDGSIISMKQDLEKIEIFMESAEIIPEWNVGGIILSNYNTIRGKLIIIEIGKIYINKNQVRKVEQNYDEGEIMNFEMENGYVNLNIQWHNYFPKKNDPLFENIFIYANQITWENLPYLFYP